MATTGNAGRLGGSDCRLDAVDVDGDQNDAVDLLGDVVLDRVVLRARHVVGIEDDQLDAGGIGRLLRPVIDLIEEQGLLVDVDESERIGERRSHGSRAHGNEGGATDEKFEQTHFRFPFSCGPNLVRLVPLALQARGKHSREWLSMNLKG